jgi:hypothetical protein
LVEVDNAAEQKEQEEGDEGEQEEGEEARENDEEREGEEKRSRANLQQYKLGELVTFTFSHFDKYGSPVRARLQRRRTDITWQEAVENFRIGQPVKKSLSGTLSLPLSLFFIYKNV